MATALFLRLMVDLRWCRAFFSAMVSGIIWSTDSIDVPDAAENVDDMDMTDPATDPAPDSCDAAMDAATDGASDASVAPVAVEYPAIEPAPAPSAVSPVWMPRHTPVMMNSSTSSPGRRLNKMGVDEPGRMGLFAGRV